jgi:hypothetical protein
MNVISIPDFCKKFKVNRSTVYRWRGRKAAQGVFVLVGNRYFIAEEKAESFAALVKNVRRGNPVWGKMNEDRN